MIEGQFLSQIIFPLLLAVLAFGIGTKLHFKDFGAILRKPWALMGALFIQMLVLPGIAYVIATYAGINAEYKVGLMLLAAAPTAIFSNTFSLLLRGNLALSTSFGAINSLIAIFSMPFVLAYAFRHFMSNAPYAISLEFLDGSLISMVILPFGVFAGMIFAARLPELRLKIQAYIQPAAILVGIFAISLPFFSREDAASFFSFEEMGKILPSVVLLYVALIVLGLGLGFVLRVNAHQRNTLLYELSLQNFWLAIVFALGIRVVGAEMIALPALVYGLGSFLLTLILGILVNRKEIEWNRLAPPFLKTISDNGIDNWVRKHWKFFVFLLFPIFSLLIHAHLMDAPLQGIHAWRQCETASNVANFDDINMDITAPRVYSLEWKGGLKRMEFPLMQWLFAVVWRIFGQHLWLIRLSPWILGFLASIAVFRLTDFLLKDKFVAVCSAWTWLNSPLIFYYIINPLPDNFSLMLALWGLVFFLKGYRENRLWLFWTCQLLLAMATASKLPFILFFAVPWAFELGNLVKTRGKSFGTSLLRMTPGILFLGISLAWYAWVIPQWSGNGVVGGILHTTSEDIPELLRILQQNLISILPELLIGYGSLGFFLLGIGELWRKKYLKHALAFPFGFMAFGAILYFLFEINMITDIHDYYLFPFMPGIFIFVAFGIQRMLEFKHRFVQYLFVIMLVSLPLLASLRVFGRFNHLEMSPNLTKCAVEIQKTLPKTALLYSVNDFSPHITLFHFRRFGWTAYSKNFESIRFENALKYGATHFVSTNRELEVNPVIQPHLGELILTCEDFKVWELK